MSGAGVRNTAVGGDLWPVHSGEDSERSPARCQPPLHLPVMSVRLLSLLCQMFYPAGCLLASQYLSPQLPSHDMVVVPNEDLLPSANMKVTLGVDQNIESFGAKFFK